MKPPGVPGEGTGAAEVAAAAPRCSRLTSLLPGARPTATTVVSHGMWGTRHGDSSAQMALAHRAPCEAGGHHCLLCRPHGTAGAAQPSAAVPERRGSTRACWAAPGSFHLLHWANWFKRDCWVTNYGTY